VSDPIPVTRFRVAGVVVGIAVLIAIVSIVVLINRPDRAPGASDSGAAAIGGATGPPGSIGSGPAASRPASSPGATPSRGAASPGATGALAAGAYPTTARAYATATLTAWSAHDTEQVKLLTTAVALAQIRESGFPDPSWTYVSCDGSTCLFRNDTGDEVEVQVAPGRLGAANAVSGVTLNQTEFAGSPTAYVNGFLHAWQAGNTQRMRQMATAKVVTQVLELPIIGDYSLDVKGFNNTYSLVTATAGNAEVQFKVLTEPGARPHGIAGMCTHNCP
jgi:hypothetical protein